MRWGRGIVALTSVVWLTGCGTTIEPGDPDAGTVTGPEAALLTFDGEPRRSLVFGEHTSFRVRYTEADGVPIPDATVSFILDGNAQDSSIDSLDAVTDAGGYASGELMAGATAAAYRVRVSAPRAASTFLDVSVSDRGFGGLQVVLSPYDGGRLMDRVRFSLFSEAACADAMERLDAADRAVTVDFGEARALFRTLPAGLEYAVVASGLGPSDELLGTGCVDGITLEADVDTQATVTLSDLPLEAEGNYDLRLSLMAEPTAVRLGNLTGRAALQDAALAGSDAALLLDAMEEWVRTERDAALADALAEDRVVNGLEDSLGAELSGAGVGPTPLGQELATETTDAFRALVLEGRLQAEPADPRPFSFQPRLLYVGGEQGQALEVLSGPLGLGVPTTVTAVAIDGEDALELTALSLRVPLGHVVLSLFHVLALSQGEPAPEYLFDEVAGCALLAPWASSHTAAQCDADCARSACLGAVADAISKVILQLEVLTGVRSEIELSGRLTLHEESGDLTADHMTSERLEGVWTGEESPDDDPVTGILEARRAEEL